MPGELKSLCLECSRLRTLDLGQIRNLEQIIIEDTKDSVELIMPVETLELRFLQLIGTTLRTLDLARTSNLETLHLHNCVSLVELHMPVESLKLKCLDIFNSKLRTLDLARTPNLKTLYLGKCEHLVELQLQAICTLQCLRDLTLDGNFLKVPMDLHKLEFLKKLTLSSGKIKHLPSSICMFKYLKALGLKSCHHLEELPEDLGRLECVEDLDLSDCIFLRHIPNSICEMKHLKIFQLSFCFLVEKLPEELGRLKCLEDFI